MRFVGAVLVVVGLGFMYFMAYKGMTIDQARTRLASLLNLPGLKPPAAPAGSPGFAGIAGNAGKLIST